MRKYLLASSTLLMVATPAVAKDGAFYAGIEAGVLFPKDPDRGTVNVDFTTTNATIPPGGPLVGGGPPGPSDFTFDDPFNFDTKIGIDADLIAGYDFGMFRVEGELGYKHAKTDSDVDATFLSELNSDLNRPSVAPDPGAPGLPALTAADFDLDGKVHAWSAMLNGLLDFGGNDGFGAYIGGGIGYANVHALGHSSGKFAWQAIAGVYYPISENIDIGLKGRYFSAGSFDTSDTFTFAGNTNRFSFGPLGAQVPVDQTTNAVLSTDSTVHFRSISLLASLVYNFARPVPLPPPAPPPPSPPPPPPTQTCPDGSVILATSSCPAPLLPPPPPPVERGERGK